MKTTAFLLFINTAVWTENNTQRLIDKPTLMNVQKATETKSPLNSPIVHAAAVDHIANPLPAFFVVVIWRLHCHASQANRSRMKGHRITPFFGFVTVIIVTRTVLFLGVQLVPVDSVSLVGIPSPDKVFTSWGWSVRAIVFCLLSRWLFSTCYQLVVTISKNKQRK